MIRYSWQVFLVQKETGSIFKGVLEANTITQMNFGNLSGLMKNKGFQYKETNRFGRLRYSMSFFLGSE